MSRQSKTEHERTYVQKERTYVQTFARSKLIGSSSCVQKTLCLDFRTFKITYDQTFVRSKPKFVRSISENLWVRAQTIVRSRTPMSRLSFGQKYLCVLRAFKGVYVQTFVRSCPDLLPVYSYKLYITFLYCINFKYRSFWLMFVMKCPAVGTF